MDITDTIDYIKACRDTHVDVVQYFDNGYTIWDWLKESGSIEEALGPRDFHQECVDDYNQIIRVLEEVLDE